MKKPAMPGTGDAGLGTTTANLERANEEAQLLARVAQRDRESFEELHRRLATLLFTSALGVLNNREAAQDVTQDVFLQIWEKAPTYDPSRGKAATWAMTLTRNKAIDRLRSNQRRSRLRDDVEKESLSELQFDDRDSLHEALSHERGAAVREAMEMLGEDQREAIQLAYFDDMPYPQVARTLGVPLGTVKARIRRGMMRLREELAARL